MALARTGWACARGKSETSWGRGTSTKGRGHEQGELSDSQGSGDPRRSACGRACRVPGDSAGTDLRTGQAGAGSSRQARGFRPGPVSGRRAGQAEPATGRVLRRNTHPYELVVRCVRLREHADRSRRRVPVRLGQADPASRGLHGADQASARFRGRHGSCGIHGHDPPRQRSTVGPEQAADRATADRQEARTISRRSISSSPRRSSRTSRSRSS